MTGLQVYLMEEETPAPGLIGREIHRPREEKERERGGKEVRACGCVFVCMCVPA